MQDYIESLPESREGSLSSTGSNNGPSQTWKTVVSEPGSVKSNLSSIERTRNHSIPEDDLSELSLSSCEPTSHPHEETQFTPESANLQATSAAIDPMDVDSISYFKFQLMLASIGLLMLGILCMIALVIIAFTAVNSPKLIIALGVTFCLAEISLLFLTFYSPSKTKEAEADTTDQNRQYVKL